MHAGAGAARASSILGPNRPERIGGGAVSDEARATGGGIVAKGPGSPGAHPSPALRIGAAGFVATAVACGPARMGFGLFVPHFRAEFGLDAAAIGRIGSLAFLASLAGLLVVGALTRRFGARVPVFLGCAAAVAGLALVGLAESAFALGVGIALAAASSGLCWVPYNRAVERAVASERRPTVLSVVSTGTTFGIVAAGALALGASLASLSWRPVWLAFAAAAALAWVVNALALPRHRTPGPTVRPDARERPAERRPSRLGALATRASVPVHLAAFSFGLLYAVFLSFGVDTVAAHAPTGGGGAGAIGARLFVAFGVAGIAGLASGALARRLGEAVLVALALVGVAAAFAALALAPERFGLALGAAALMGAATMIVCAALSFWSLTVYPGLPALGFNAVIVVMTLGSVAGPILVGAAFGEAGVRAAFGAGAATALALAGGLVARGRPARRPGAPAAGRRGAGSDATAAATR